MREGGSPAVNDATLLTQTSVTDWCLLAEATVAHSLTVQGPPWTRGQKTVCEHTTTQWLLSLLSAWLPFHLNQLQVAQVLPSYNVPNRGCTDIIT